MSLSRTERFKLKSRLLDEIHDRDGGWDLSRQNLLLSEFGFQTVDGDYDGPSFEDRIGMVSDSDLLEIYSLVTGVEEEQVQDALEAAEPSNWKAGYVRLFISHSARHKKFMAEVADELAVVGIHGFVAHETMVYSKPWQQQIEQGLRTMQAFVAIIHEEFNDSAWCHQEVGWALGRRVPHYVVRMGTDPAGFIGHDQWPAVADQTPKSVAQVISTWASSVPELGEIMTTGLFAALQAANNYVDAGATAQRIASLSELTQEQWTRLATIFWENDQVFGGALACRALKPLFVQHQMEWPPPKADRPRLDGNPRSRHADEAPL